MAETIISALSKQLRRGYEIRRIDGRTYGVFDPHGNIVKDGGSLLSFKDGPTGVGHYFPNLLAALRRNNAIQPRQKAKPQHERRPPRQVATNDPKNSVIIAQETLRDTNATPRERALARNYLQLLESQAKLRQLARALGERLKEIEDLQD